MADKSTLTNEDIQTLSGLQGKKLSTRAINDERDALNRRDVKEGVISAEGIESGTRFNIPEAPRPQVPDAIIANTRIPTEDQRTQQQDSANISQEANTLRETISGRQDILSELGLGDIKDSFESLLQKGQFTQRAEDQAGISDKTTALNDIDNQLRETNLKFTRNIEAIQDASGLTRGQKNARLSEVSRKQARQLADLSIIQATRRDNLTTAQSLVDRKVELEFEPIEQKLQFQQFLFQENKELFTTAEQRQFESKVRKEQVQIDKDKVKFGNLEQMKANFTMNAAEAGQGNAYLQSIQAAESQDDLFGISGIQNYSVTSEQKLNKQLLNLKITSELEQAQAAKDAKASGLLSSSQLNLTDDLRSEYNNLAEVKDAKDLESNTTSLLLALEQENGVGDISAINTFQRLVVDPGVAVREGDVALLQSAQSFTDKAFLKAQGLLVGDKLTEGARTQMKDLALSVYDARIAIVDERTSNIKNRAEAGGIGGDDYGKYIGQNYESSSAIKDKVSTLDPAENVLSSYDDVIDTPEVSLNFFSNWLSTNSFE